MSSGGEIIQPLAWGLEPCWGYLRGVSIPAPGRSDHGPCTPASPLLPGSGPLGSCPSAQALLRCCSFSLSAGDAPYCTPEQYKECADPALGEPALPPPCRFGL